MQLRSPFSRTRPTFGTPPIYNPTQHLPGNTPGEDDSAVDMEPAAPKRVHAFDKDHIADTLLSIGQGFLSNQNFADGLGAAAGAIREQNGLIRQEQTGKTTYGGPDNRFKITTFPDGRQQIDEVPEFSDAVREKAALAKQPSPDKMTDIRSRVIYQIAQLPPEQRAAAYQSVRTNPQAYGIDTTGLPDQWDDNYGRVAGGTGFTAPQAANLDLGRDRLAFARESFERKQAAATAKQSAKGIKAKAPPSRRGGRAKASGGNSDLSYLMN